MRKMLEQLEFRTILKLAIASMALAFLILYALFQARFLVAGPQIVLSHEPDSIQNERRIYLEGTTYNISRLWLNDRQIYTNAQGSFKEAFILENGYTVSTLRAEDRYGRQTNLSRSFMYIPASFTQ